MYKDIQPSFVRQADFAEFYEVTKFAWMCEITWSILINGRDFLLNNK